MKTPREILIAHHQAAKPKLDAVRQRVVAEALGARPAERETVTPPSFGSRPNLFVQLWLELIWPSRRIWAGLAGVWLAILALNLSSPTQRSVTVAGERRVGRLSPQVAEVLQDQKRLMAELLETEVDRPVPPRWLPAPRSALPTRVVST